MILFYRKRKKTLRSKIIFFDIMTTLIPLVLCTVILFILIFNVFTDFIRNDMKFFLKETNNNIQNKTLLLEDTLLRVRDNMILEDYLLDILYQSYTTKNSDTLHEQFKLAIDIYSDKNVVEPGTVFIQQVYLFDRNGKSLSEFYYSPLQKLEAEFDHKFEEIYKTFLNQSSDVLYVLDGENINVVFTLYSKSMQNIGTIIFVINKEIIHGMMQGIDHYENAFWFMFDKYGNILLEDPTKRLSLDDKLNMIATYQNDVYEEKVQNRSYLIHTKRMDMGMNMVIGVPSNQLSLLLFDSIGPYVYIFLLILLIVSIFSIVTIYKLTKPLKEVADHIKMVGNGELSTRMPEFSSLEFAHISRVFNTMTEKMDYLINDVYKKQLIIRESELKFLQTQVNPHFMFNVLNTIALKAKIDNNEEIYRMISSFAGLIQASIYRTDKELVTIKQELTYIDFYLYLQSYRFGEKLSYKIHYEDERLLELYVPKLTIQFIVENAVVHGIEPKYKNGSVEVHIYTKNSRLFIDVIDDGIGFEHVDGVVELPLQTGDDKDGHNRVGLQNTNKIIQHFYGSEYGIQITTKRNVGTTVSIQLPLDTTNSCKEDQDVQSNDC